MALANPFLKGIEQQEDTSSPETEAVFTNMVAQESGGRHLDKSGNLLKSSAGAEGITQLLPTTAKDPGYGVTPVKNKSEQEYLRFGKDYFTAMLNEFKGDPEKAAAAYNAGPGAIKDAISKYGINWKNNIPKETKDYITKTVKPETKSTGNPFLKGVDTGNPFLKGISTEEPAKPEEDKKGVSALEAIDFLDTKYRDLALSAGKGIVGEALSVANVALGTPEFITKVGSQLVNAPASAIEKGLQGRGYTPDWDKSTERSAFLGETLFGPATKAVPKLAEVTGLTPTFEESGINTALNALSSGMESTATKIEEKTGIPKAGSLAVMETAMVTGVPGARAVAKRVARTVKDLADSTKMDPGSAEWTGKEKPWVVPETTDTGVPISTGAVTMPDGTPALDTQGRPVIARHWRNEDGTSSHIQLNLEEAAKRFESKPWVKGGLSEGTFKTPTEYAQFILEHENQHTRTSFEDYKKMVDPQGDLFTQKTGLRSEEQLRKDYEHYTNIQALEATRADPVIGQPDVNVPKIPKDTTDPQWLDDALYSLGKAKSHDLVIASARLKAAEAEGVTVAMQQKWRDAAEGHGTLDPRETELFNKYYAAEAAERAKLTKYNQDKGWIPKSELDPSLTGANVARKIVPTKMTRLEKAKVALSGGKFGGFDPNIKAKPGAALDRSVFVLETPGNARLAGLLRDKDGKFIADFDIKPVLEQAQLTGLVKDAEARRMTKVYYGQKVNVPEQVKRLKQIRTKLDVLRQTHPEYLSDSNKRLLKELETRALETERKIKLNEYARKNTEWYNDRITRLEKEAGGARRVVQAGPEGVVFHWNEGKASPFTTMKQGDSLKAGTNFGGAKVKEAYESEIERHTQYEYEKATQAVLYERLAELREFTRANEFLEDLSKSSWMTENSHKITPNDPIPEGYKRPKHVDKIPQFDGYAFKDNIAEIIEDFAISRNPNALTYLSGALIKNMMLNPLPHMMNEAWHVYNARGLTGWVTPAGIYRFVRTGMPALISSIKQDKAYLDTLNEGGSIMSADVRANATMDNFFQKGLKEFSDTPEFQDLATKMGMSALETYDAISKKSNIAMWTVRDAMYLQLVNEKMRYEGMTRKEAIKEVERHMPSYRVPHRVMGSRMLSEVLQNPSYTIFSRYHYGLVNSLKETAADLAALRKGQAGVKDFLHGLDTAAAIAVAIGVLYPLQDMVAQWLSGNEDAKQRRAGPYHIIHAIAGIAEHEKDPMAFISSIFTFNPPLQAGIQLLVNRKLYNGQPIYHPEDSGKKIAYDIAKYVITQLPMASQAEKAQKEEDEGFKNWQMRQLDIESPTAETVIKREKQKNIREKAGARRTGKWEAGL